MAKQKIKGTHPVAPRATANQAPEQDPKPRSDHNERPYKTVVQTVKVPPDVM